MENKSTKLEEVKKKQTHNSQQSDREILKVHKLLSNKRFKKYKKKKKTVIHESV